MDEDGQRIGQAPCEQESRINILLEHEPHESRSEERQGDRDDEGEDVPQRDGDGAPGDRGGQTDGENLPDGIEQAQRVERQRDPQEHRHPPEKAQNSPLEQRAVTCSRVAVSLCFDERPAAESPCEQAVSHPDGGIEQHGGIAAPEDPVADEPRDRHVSAGAKPQREQERREGDPQERRRHHHSG